MKKSLAALLLATAFTLVAAELKHPAFRMSEPELLAVLQENDLNDRATACQELGHKGTPAAVPALAALLADAADPVLFHAARHALQNIPGPEADAALAAAEQSLKDPKRRAALQATRRLRATPVPPGYAGAAATLTAFPPKTPVQNGEPKQIPLLVEQALAGGFPATLARRQLVGFPNDAVVDAMLALAADPDTRKVKLALGVLGDRRVRAVLPRLCELARTTRAAGVRAEVFKAFATLCDANDLPLLLDLLKDMPREDRLVGSLIRLASRAFVADQADIKVLKAEYGYFGPDQVRNDKGEVVQRPVADVRDMVSELVRAGSRAIMASNRLAGHGGFAHDPAPGHVKELRLVYQIGDGPQMSTVTPENLEAELAGCRLPAAVAKPLVDACAAATGDHRAALARILETLEKRGTVPGIEQALFRPIFNGQDLSGWSQQDGYFSVRDGAILGASTPERLCKPNHHLVYTAETFADFELRAEFRLSAGANSGIQLRCLPQFIGDNGYQADMDGGGNYVGFLYHPKQHLVGERGADVAIDAEGRKTVTRFADGKKLQEIYRKEQWNDIRVVVKDRSITVWINGVRTTSVEDPRASFLPARGHIALQLHQGPAMTVAFRNLRVRPF